MRSYRSLLLVGVSAVGLCITPSAVLAQADPTPTGSPPDASQASPAAETPPPATDAAPPANPADNGQIAEIVVTAEKREASVQKTPIAIDVLNGAALAKDGVGTVEQLQSVLPSVQFAQAGSNTIVAVRGVSGRDTTEIGDPAVAINADGIFLQRPGGLNVGFFDLDRIEVLKGPQGTLYGRNATGGVINIISKRPDFKFGGYGQFTYGNYNQISGEGAINVPITDTLAVRGSFISRQHDGYINVSQPATANPATNVPGAGSPANRANVRGDDDDSKGARVQVLFKPSSRFSALISGTYIRQGGVGPVFVGEPVSSASPPTKRSQIDDNPLDEPGDYRLVRENFLTELNYDFGFAKATYLFGYVRVDQTQLFDNDGTNYRHYDFRAGNYSSDYSHEIRLASTGNGPFTWQIGGYFYKEGLDVRSLNFVEPAGTPIILRNFQYHVDVKSRAGFGQVSYALTDKLKISGGIRYSTDDKARTGGRYTGPGLVNADSQTTQPTLTFIPETAASQSSSSDVSYHAGIDYQITPRNLIYAKTDKGYKSGGFTTINEYGPEEVIAYEVGSKNRFFDNSLQLNVDAFLYNYKDQQVSQVTTAGVQVLNAGKSRVKGVEGQLDWRATPFDSINLSVNYLDARFRRFSVAVSGVNVSEAGNRLIQSPKWGIAGGYEHNFDLGDRGTLTPRAQATYRSAQYFTFFNNPNDRQRAYATVELSLTYTSPGNRWSVQGFVRNLTNQTILTNASIGSFTGTNIYQFAPPRTFGGTLRANF